MALGKLLGKFRVPLDLEGANEKAIVFHNGWVSIGKSKLDGAQMHFNVRAQLDLRYVFQLTGKSDQALKFCNQRNHFRGCKEI